MTDNTNEETVTMNRQALTDGSGEWFNLATSEKFHADSSTLQILHITDKGRFVLHDWENGSDSFGEWTGLPHIVKWLSNHGHDPVEVLGADCVYEETGKTVAEMDAALQV